MRYVPLVGRILYSLIFLMSGMTVHFSAQGVQFAEAHGVPAASVLVPLSGILAVLGALSIILGYRAKLGAWLLVLFLVPVTFTMHAFWAITDPMQQSIQMSMFLKNLALLGGALLIAYHGAGPLSLDERKQA
ncbi:MAG: DoxX family protein [Chlorobiota bacterium]|jgi:putative oxidoreductase|nr:MAG: DoxX family protein [Chlorobiota bacterium]